MKNKIRFGVIGCGRISYKHLESIKEIGAAELVAVCDKKEQLAKDVAEKYGCDYYTDYLEMLKREDIDIVNVCTPNHNHPEITQDIAKHKKHVITEKPMSLSVEEGEMMINVCNENGVKLFVVKQNRYNPPIVKLKEALDEGRFGKLILGNVTVRWNRNQEYYSNNDWHGSKTKDGGMLFTQASHHVDMLQWIMGPIESVQAKVATLNHDIEIEDTAVATIKFKNGALGVIEATTCTFPKNLEGSITILGEKGTVKIGGMAMNKMDHWEFSDFKNDDDSIKEVATFPSNVYGFGHKKVIENAVNLFLNKGGINVHGEEGLESVKIIRAIYESSETGKEIKF